ncbi:hypothetical protein CHLRE_07g347050v5 [Chlamydomonas reinhardtii]|uniref:EF-hand domain-containing protein n=1 Tax=Chlamydomonas reinhardtii TaxID=3055 RepID=A0A2K3DL29_CHLRE|nr:uncharacterized protein CHLRE_07g347050v5 [Chlamydomonas reinhardtii]7JTK_M Chain M, Flagellar radial spoke protein 7 [Chlamydomonas reinhardtii]7JTK_N Chain N, Flagellar radial spoke protein 7 [Chlamydomonas reinhardtii]7JU4_M Chain M, Radial spoke protein 7 [Chlamydomonas reinhardtii]7JU4_N Chain N, Radial spoke protein 7 [Chlamydomonas reinhardtii]8GLV_IC Chain IC, Radial spoke protein 7 [Chlamydomonas reinhardtii]8GLV_IE Chain IE, Radial spoke protein 7 [Chlamydomonas reinhardtii]8GLV
MSSTYQKPITIPGDFPAILKAFTREILRAQPSNIYEFGARYFSGLQGQAEPEGLGRAAPVEPASTSHAATSKATDVEETAVMFDIAALTPAELEPILMKLFIEADADRSGFLDRHEFTAVLRNANLKLSDRQIRQILAEADENDDDVIQYKEFLPIMVDILQSIKAKEQAKAMMHGVETMVRTEVETMLLHGLPQEELQALMLKVFKKADADGSGQLNRHEFKEALKAAELGLTRKDINLILSHIDVDRDGLVSYEEFIPVCFQVLVERFKDEIVVNDILGNADELQQMLLGAFRDADPDNTGLLSQRQVKSIFKELSYKALGLTTLQMVSLISQAPTTPDGMVQYIQFVPQAASIIRSMYDVETMKGRMHAIKAVAEAGGIAALGALDLDQLRGVLEQAFQRVDTEGAGQLTLPQVTQVLDGLNSLAPDANLALSDQHMKAMFAAIDADESGTVDWTELVNFICDALEHIEREAYVANMRDGGAGGAGEAEASPGDEEA